VLIFNFEEIVYNNVVLELIAIFDVV